MSKITGGEVGYGRTVKTGDFENKRVDVKLSFTVDDGEDHVAILQAAAKEAHDKAHAMLGIKVAEKVEKPEPVAPPLVEKKKPETKEAAAASMNAKDKAKPASVPAVKPTPEGEDFGEGFDESAPDSMPEISDAMMTTAMSQKMAELIPVHAGASGKKIKELINTFVEHPKKSHDIPQNLRHTFLDKLKLLK